MAQDNDPSDLEIELERYKRLLDPVLSTMTHEALRQLVKEIEDQLAQGDE